MSVKQEVLRILTEQNGAAVSGEMLANKLQVSRNAIWKAIKSLEDEGYAIKGVNRVGYRLLKESDQISRVGILSYIKPEFADREIIVFDVTDSTNNQAKMLAATKSVDGTLITANEQTNGRGRRGHSFFSPAGTGIYMSICFSVDTDFAGGVLYTTAAAVAVARAIERVAPVKAMIKWVNDIYIEEKKVCGILSEAVTDMESGRISTVVVGIGVNVTTQDFPEEISQTAAAVSDNSTATIRNRLIAEIYNEMMTWASNPEDRSFMEEYRSRSMLLNRKITYTSPTGVMEGIARAITDAGELVIETETGERITVNSGECSAKPLEA